MSHRPYPDAERARRRQRGAPMSPARARLAEQAAAALAAMGAALRPVQEALVQAGAPRSAPFPVQMITVLDRGLKEECARSAPGVLALHRMAQAMRSR